MPDVEIFLPDHVLPIVENLGVPLSDWVCERLVAERSRQLVAAHWAETSKLADQLALTVDWATVAELRGDSRDAE